MSYISSPQHCLKRRWRKVGVILKNYKNFTSLNILINKIGRERILLVVNFMQYKTKKSGTRKANKVRRWAQNCPLLGIIHPIASLSFNVTAAATIKNKERRTLFSWHVCIIEGFCLLLHKAHMKHCRKVFFMALFDTFPKNFTLVGTLSSVQTVQWTEHC